MSSLSSTDMRDAFLTTLYNVAASDRRVMILSNDFGAPSLDRFRADMPRQFINSAISEQNMVGTAAGLALGGFFPVIYSIASFASLRCFEQIKIDLSVMNLPVTILAVGACYAYSADGPTHHATEDIALMRSLANMELFSPSEPAQCVALAESVVGAAGPRYVRVDRGKWPVLASSQGFPHGLRTFGDGRDLAIISTGVMLHRAREVAAVLAERNIQAKVIDLYRLKPFNGQGLLEAVGSVAQIVTLEEHTIHGGLGGIVAEFIADQNLGVRLTRCAISDELLYAYGSREQLHLDRGLDVASLSRRLEKLVDETGRKP